MCTAQPIVWLILALGLTLSNFSMYYKTSEISVIYFSIPFLKSISSIDRMRIPIIWITNNNIINSMAMTAIEAIQRPVSHH